MLPTWEQQELEMEMLSWMLGERRETLLAQGKRTPSFQHGLFGCPVLAAEFHYEMDACGLGWRHDPGAN